MFDSNPHGKSRVYEQETLWDTQFIHGDQSTSGISHQEKRKNCIQNEVGVSRYFYSSESFTDHKVRTSTIVCSFRMDIDLLVKLFRSSFGGNEYGSFRR
jgi:hypothetical protein